jgi:hypothetical protein
MVEGSDFLSFIRSALLQREGIPMNIQWLFFGRALLQDGIPLASQGIAKDTNIRLHLSPSDHFAVNMRSLGVQTCVDRDRLSSTLIPDLRGSGPKSG